MVVGMANRKTTVTLPEEQVRAIRGLVQSGRSASISGFIQKAVQTALLDSAVWRKSIEESLQRTGGPLSAEEAAWADSVLGVSPPKTRRSRVA